MELTGVFKRALDPEIDRLTVVVWNHSPEKTVDNSISIRLESNYSGIANIIVIIGLLVFYIGMSRKEEKKSNKDVIEMRKSIAKIKTRFTFYPEHYITGPRSSQELILQGYCDNVLNVLNEKPIHTGRVWYQGIKLRNELRNPIQETIELPIEKPSKITYYYFSTGL